MWEEGMPEAVAELRRSLYVDDLLSGGQTIEQATEGKSKAVKIFEDTKFNCSPQMVLQCSRTGRQQQQRFER
jgi:hypothetical protein